MIFQSIRVDLWNKRITSCIRSSKVMATIESNQNGEKLIAETEKESIQLYICADSNAWQLSIYNSTLDLMFLVGGSGDIVQFSFSCLFTFFSFKRWPNSWTHSNTQHWNTFILWIKTNHKCEIILIQNWCLISAMKINSTAWRNSKIDANYRF